MKLVTKGVFVNKCLIIRNITKKIKFRETQKILEWVFSPVSGSRLRDWILFGNKSWFYWPVSQTLPTAGYLLVISCLQRRLGFIWCSNFKRYIFLFVSVQMKVKAVRRKSTRYVLVLVYWTTTLANFLYETHWQGIMVILFHQNKYSVQGERNWELYIWFCDNAFIACF